jgi:hypothetical protein
MRPTKATLISRTPVSMASELGAMRHEADAAAERIEPAAVLPDSVLPVQLVNIANFSGTALPSLAALEGGQDQVRRSADAAPLSKRVYAVMFPCDVQAHVTSRAAPDTGSSDADLRVFLSRKAFVITEAELRLIASAATIGDSNQPVSG